MNDLEANFHNTGDALTRLGEILQMHAPQGFMLVLMEATIQRFEFTVEQLWKLLHKILQQEKVVVTPTPKQIMQKAYAAGWLNDEKLWLDMLDDRNETSHDYNHDKAREIYERIKGYYPVMQKTFDELKKKYGKH